MTDLDIINFKNSIANLSLEELKQKKIDLDDALTKMIFDSDLMFKIAIVTAALEEKGIK